jgi:hypothetical protein
VPALRRLVHERGLTVPYMRPHLVARLTGEMSDLTLQRVHTCGPIPSRSLRSTHEGGVQSDPIEYGRGDVQRLDDADSIHTHGLHLKCDPCAHRRGARPQRADGVVDQARVKADGRGDESSVAPN